MGSECRCLILPPQSLLSLCPVRERGMRLGHCCSMTSRFVCVSLSLPPPFPSPSLSPSVCVCLCVYACMCMLCLWICIRLHMHVVSVHVYTSVHVQGVCMSVFTPLHASPYHSVPPTPHLPAALSGGGGEV